MVYNILFQKRNIKYVIEYSNKQMDFLQLTSCNKKICHLGISCSYILEQGRLMEQNTSAS